MNNMDKYLHIVGEHLQITPEKYEELNKNYIALSDYIADNHVLADIKDVSIYQQGSFAIDTVIRPLKGDDFDVDMVVEFDMSKEVGAVTFYNALYKTFSDGRYKDKLEKFKNNIRINYQNNYHFDIMPTIPESQKSQSLFAPDLKKADWVIRSPKLYAQWFKEQSKKVTIQNKRIRFNDLKGKYLLEDVDVSPLNKPASYLMKAPLNRVIQLLKRARDVFFYHTEENVPQSIVLTTLAASYYDGSLSVFDALKRIVMSMKDNITSQVIDVKNPVCPQESFTDKWKKEVKYYDNYKKYVNHVYENILKLEKDASKGKEALKKLFGESSLQNLQESTKEDSFWNVNQSLLQESRNIFPDKKVQINQQGRGNA